MRSAIGATIYQWRSHNSHSPAENARVTREAEFALKQAFAYCPYSPEAVFHLMNQILSAGRIDDALLVLKTCHKLDPYNGQIDDWINQLERGKTSAGADQINQFLAQIQRAIEARQTNAAGQMLDQLLHFPAADPNIMMTVAAMYLRIGDLAKTEEAFQRLTQMVPDSSGPWYNLALVQANRGETARAVAALKKALAMNPGEIRQNPKTPNLREHLYQDPGFGGLRQTPEFKAAFPSRP
jgi:tetratricopeptide (TPR) repeat protein